MSIFGPSWKRQLVLPSRSVAAVDECADDLCDTLLLSVYVFVQRELCSSTLFPYTTLFRSGSCMATRTCASVVLSRLRARSRKSWLDASCDSNRSTTDRKSTRLNSSHTVISYAVFCLKKKTK